MLRSVESHCGGCYFRLGYGGWVDQITSCTVIARVYKGSAQPILYLEILFYSYANPPFPLRTIYDLQNVKTIQNTLKWDQQPRTIGTIGYLALQVIKLLTHGENKRDVRSEESYIRISTQLLRGISNWGKKCIVIKILELLS